MATIKQKQALKEIVENGGNVSKAMLKVKYSKATAKTPQKLTESKGFIELCNEIGLTDDFIGKCLVEDLKGKPLDRSKELGLAMKAKGLFKADNEQLKPNLVSVDEDVFVDIIKAYKAKK